MGFHVLPPFVAFGIQGHGYAYSDLVPLRTVHPSRELYERGLALRDRYGLSFHDSIVVVGAIQSGCVRLYSEDLQHRRRIQSLTVEIPFRAPVEGRPT
jgi:predicted nucleic acid-binding protein